MDNKTNTWLFDIKTAINEIESFFEDGKKIFKNYKNRR